MNKTNQHSSQGSTIIEDDQAQEQEKLEILFQDEQLIAVHKPAGMLVHKSPIDKQEKRYAMRVLRNQIGQWVYPVHRLDKPTSGLLLFALDSDIARLVAEQFENRTVQKRYFAVVRGFTAEELDIDYPLKEIAVFKSEQEKADAKEAKSALTQLKRLQTFELPFSDGRFPTSRYSYLELSPKTGRKHQLRRHMKHISHPIAGDVKYGKGNHNRIFREELECDRLMLAASDLLLTHPVTGDPLKLHCPFEADFQTTLDTLNRYKTD
jgi:tRNA pseudouridine65 synthase